MKTIDFGSVNGGQVKIFALENENVKAEILNYGGTIRSLKVKDKNGAFTDVALGYDDIDGYVKNDGYLGALIGRVGNRINKGTFILNGKTYRVGINDGENSLHGGIKGFDKKIWDSRIDGEKLVLTTFSPDGEEGYPGNLNVQVSYSLTDKGIKIEYEATCDSDTVISMTNHCYFNLDGAGNGDILSTSMFIDADGVTPTNEKLIPTGSILPVEGTPFDFRKPKLVGKDIESDDEYMKNCGGYDINYVLNGKGFRKIAQAEGNKSGIKMSVYTDLPGVQFYSGNFLSGAKGKDGKTYGKRNGFCLETQNFPDAVNQPSFPSAVLKKGEKYHTVTEYRFNED